MCNFIFDSSCDIFSKSGCRKIHAVSFNLDLVETQVAMIEAIRCLVIVIKL